MLVRKCNRETRRKLAFPKELLLNDSTTMTVGKTRLPWAPYHGERAAVKLHVALRNQNGQPLNVTETTGSKHDGPICESLKKARLYYGHGSGLRHRDLTCQLGTPQFRSVKRHRVVIFRDFEGREIRVVTDLMGVTAEQIALMYKARWQIEVFFRWIKQHLNISTLFGTTENAVYGQLYTALIVFVLLKWLFDGAKHAFPRHAELSFVCFTRLLLVNGLPTEWVLRWGRQRRGDWPKRGEAANPAQMQEFSLVQLLSDANPAKVHHFRRFLLSIR